MTTSARRGPAESIEVAGEPSGADQPRPAEIFVARQPIYTSSLAVFGYELLFRDGVQSAFNPNMDGVAATRSVLENSFLTLGISTLTGSTRAFISFSRDLLLSDDLFQLPRNQTVIEILEDVTPDAEVLEACRELRRLGYVLALDDFIFQPGYDELLKLAKIVKVDLRGLGVLTTDL